MRDTTACLVCLLFLLLSLPVATLAKSISYQAVFGAGIDSVPTTQDPSLQFMPTPAKLNRYEILEKDHVDSLYFVIMSYPLNPFLFGDINIGTQMGLANHRDIAHDKVALNGYQNPFSPHHLILSNSTSFVLANAKWTPHLDMNWQLSISPEIGGAQNNMTEIDTLISEREEILSYSNFSFAYGGGIVLSRVFQQKAFIRLAFHILNTGRPPMTVGGIALRHSLLARNTLETKVLILDIEF